MAGGGKQPGAGRPKGVANKLTQSVKEAIEGAYRELDKLSRKKDGVAYLVKVGQDDPKTFLALYGKLVPKDISLATPGLDMATIIKELKGEDK